MQTMKSETTAMEAMFLKAGTQMLTQADQAQGPMTFALRVDRTLREVFAAAGSPEVATVVETFRVSDEPSDIGVVLDFGAGQTHPVTFHREREVSTVA